MEGTRSGRSLLAASARPRAGVLLAGCAILVAVLGVLFAHRSTADAFDHAVDEVAHIAGHLLAALETNAQPRDRDVEAAKAKARSAERFARA